MAKRFRIFKLIQGPLVAVAFGILFQIAASHFWPTLALAQTHLVTVPIADGFSDIAALFTSPDFSRIFDGTVIMTGIILAVVASLETLLCVEATDKLDPQKRTTPTNRELLAQGCGNCLSGIVGGLPVTQVIVRSSANLQSGVKTKLSTILHGILLLIFVLILPQILNMIPLAVLASILFVVGYKLAKPSIFREIYDSGMEQFIPFVVTIVGIVFTDLLVGIGLGMVCAVFMILKRNYDGAFEFSLKDVEVEDDTHRVTLKFYQEVSFLSRASVVKVLSAIPDGSHVTIDERDNEHLDPDITEILEEFMDTAKYRDITVAHLKTA